MKKVLVASGLLVLAVASMFAATKASVQVSATLQSGTMTLTVSDVQVTGKSGGTAGNGVVEFGAVSSLIDGAYATAVEALKVDFNAANNMYVIQTYTANSNANYSTANHLGQVEAGYWDNGEEANGLVGTNNTDFVAGMLWYCQSNNANVTLSNANLASWTYIKDYYTHIGGGASGLLLANFQSATLSTLSNSTGIVTAGNRPYETWTKTWNVNWAFPENNISHYVSGTDATGYRNFVYGTGGSGYTIVTGSLSKTDAGNNTVYLNLGASFQGKPAQVYQSPATIVEIIAQ